MLWALLVLRARKPKTVFAPRWAEFWAGIWAVSWAVLLVMLWAVLFFGRENRSRFSRRAGLSKKAWIGAVLWALLLVVPLRLYEPPGLRAGPSVHPGSAQPEPDRFGASFELRIGLDLWVDVLVVLLRPFRVMQFAATPRGGLL